MLMNKRAKDKALFVSIYPSGALLAEGGMEK